MRRALPAVVVLGCLGIAGACSFPNVTYETSDAAKTDARVSPDGHIEPGDDTGTEDGASQDDGSSGGSDGASSSGGDSGKEGSTMSDSSASDGSSIKDVGADAVNCDIDGDGYNGPQCPVGSSLGPDCCDKDKNANPGDVAYYPMVDGCGSYDYNCDGQETKEWATFSCAYGLPCSEMAGYIGLPPGCGDPGPWADTCVDGVLDCDAGSQAPKDQACR
jgi:hypothetical protein